MSTPAHTEAQDATTRLAERALLLAAADEVGRLPMRAGAPPPVPDWHDTQPRQADRALPKSAQAQRAAQRRLDAKEQQAAALQEHYRAGHEAGGRRERRRTVGWCVIALLTGMALPFAARLLGWLS